MSNVSELFEDEREAELRAEAQDIVERSLGIIAKMLPIADPTVVGIQITRREDGGNALGQLSLVTVQRREATND